MLRARDGGRRGALVKETRVLGFRPESGIALGYYCRGGAGSRCSGESARPGGKSKAAVDSQTGGDWLAFHCCLGECLVIIGWFVYFFGVLWDDWICLK